jgi:hypothetical protein
MLAALRSASKTVRSGLPRTVSILTCLHVVVVSGAVRPTQQEFDNLARSLDIKGPAVRGRAEYLSLRAALTYVASSPMTRLTPQLKGVLLPYIAVDKAVVQFD